MSSRPCLVYGYVRAGASPAVGVRRAPAAALELRDCAGKERIASTQSAIDSEHNSEHTAYVSQTENDNPCCDDMCRRKQADI